MDLDLTKELREFQGDEGRQKALDNALLWLQRSGVIPLLRALGRVRYVPGPAQDIALMSAMYAHRSMGYHSALDDIVYFREKYLQPVAAADSVKPLFSGLDNLLKSGDITVEEADAIRTGDFSKLKLNSTEPATAGTGSSGAGSARYPGKPKGK